MATISGFHGNTVEWAYAILDGKGWLVVRFRLGVVEAVQVSSRYRDTPIFKDGKGIAIGDSIDQVAHMAGAVRTHDNTPIAYRVKDTDGFHFYGASSNGKIDRIGKTKASTDLSAWIRWYKFDGLTPERAIGKADSYGGGAAGEEKYLSEHTCGYTGTTWHEISRTMIDVRGTRVVAASAQCGRTNFKVIKYFESEGGRPSLVIDIPSEKAAIVNRHFMSPADATTSAVWINRYAWNDGNPNGVTIVYDPAQGQGALVDYYVGYTSDPNNPVTSVDLYVDLPPEYQSMAPAVLKQHLKKETRLKPNIGFPGSGLFGSISCSVSGGTGKCNGSGTAPLPPGQPCLTPVAETPGGDIAGPTACAIVAPGHNSLPTGPRGGSCNSVGNPVDPATGQIWFKTTDVKDSGPNPLEFFHRYDSVVFDSLIQPEFQGSLGVGWRSPYDAQLDLNYMKYGQVAYYSSDCDIEYFGSVEYGYPSYDDRSGGTLVYNYNGSFTLTTWDKHVLNFDANGFLTSISDRAGITTTITRNASEGMTLVTDHYGKTLQFTLDSKNRITKAVSSPAGVSLTFTYDSGTNCYTGDLCTATESDGGKWTYQYFNPSSYAGNHLLKEVLDPLNHIEENNTFSSVQLPENDVATYRVATQSTDGGKNAYTFSYADCTCTTYATTKATAVTDALGRTGTFQWNVMQSGVSSVPPLFNKGGQLSYTYDDFNRPTNDGEYTTYQYNRDIPVVNPDGSSWSYWVIPGVTDIYAPLLLTKSGYVYPHTNVTFYPTDITTYPTGQLDDLPQTVITPSIEIPTSTISDTYTFNNSGELTQLSRTGFVKGISTTRNWSMTYNSDENLTSYTTPRSDLVQAFHFGYYSDTDANYWRRGKLQTLTDPLGHITTFAADTHANCGGATCATYSAFGKPESITDPNGVVQDFSYDSMGRRKAWFLLAATGDTTQRTLTQTYDAAGRPVLFTDPNGFGLKTTYDNNNNLLSVIRLGTSSYQEENLTYGYDSMSQRTSALAESCVTPAATCATWTTAASQTIAYSTVAQLQSATFNTATPEPITFSYNGQYSGRDVSQATYGNTSVQPVFANYYNYDQLHNVTQYLLSQSMASYSTRNTFNQIDSIEQYTPFANFSTDYNRDDFGNETGVVSPTTGTEIISTDAVGNILSDTKANGATRSMTYDADNRLITLVATKPSMTTENIAITYDSSTTGHFGIGRVASVSDPSGTTAYQYDRVGHVVNQQQTINGVAYTIATTYDGDGNALTVALPTGKTVTYTYDFADRPLSAKTGSITYVSSATYEPFGKWKSITFGNAVVQSRTFDQSLSPVTDVVKTGGGTVLSNTTYQYGATRQTMSITDNLNAAYNQSFGYDQSTATNSLNSDTTGSSLWGSGQYTVNSDTEDGLTTIAQGSAQSIFYYTQPNILTSVSGVSVTEDASGNETSVGSAAYTYSARNHLQSGDGITYSYDWRERRVLAVSAAATRGYIYSTDGKLYAETAPGGTTLGYDYIWFGSIPVAQDVVGGSTYWTHTNRLGAPFLQTTTSGAVYWQADYYPYGAIFQLRAGSGVHQPLRLPGQEAEQLSAGSGPNGDTGRYYNGARWYRPAWGRFTQPDPIGLFGDPMNLYAYALLNPETFVDPSGLCGDSGGSGGAPPPGPGTPPDDNPHGCDPAGDADAPPLPPGDSWSFQYQYGINYQTYAGLNYANDRQFYFVEVDLGLFNYQVFGTEYRPASNFGLGVYGIAAGIPEWQVFAAIIAVGMKDHLQPWQIIQDQSWADDGYTWANAFCH